MPTDLINPDDGSLSWQKHCEVSPELAEVLNKMVAMWLKDRYKSATEVLEALALLETQVEDLSRDHGLNPFVLKLQDAEESWIREVAWETLSDREIQWCSEDQRRLMAVGVIQSKFDLPVQEAEEFLEGQTLPKDFDYSRFIVRNRDGQAGKIDWTHGNKVSTRNDGEDLSRKEQIQVVAVFLGFCSSIGLCIGLSLASPFSINEVNQESPPAIEQPSQ